MNLIKRRVKNTIRFLINVLSRLIHLDSIDLYRKRQIDLLTSLFDGVTNNNFSFIKKEDIVLHDVALSVCSLTSDHSIASVCKEFYGDGKQWDYEMIDKINFMPSDIVIDIGANYGLTSMYIAKKYKQVKLFSIEPSHVIFEIFKQNLHYNNIENIYPLNYGVGKDSAKVNFTLNLSGSLGSSNTIGCDAYRSYLLINEHVEIISTFEFMQKFKDPIKLLKIDCEGAEFEFFENVSDDFLKQIEYLILEIHPYVCNAKSRFKAIEQRLKKCIKFDNIKIIDHVN